MPKLKSVNKNTVGFYLKEIRTKYALDQNDLIGGNVKRSKLAKIELNDNNTVLTEEYAKEIANNINKIITPKYNEEVNYMYFFNNTIYKSTEAAKSYLEQLETYSLKNDNKNFTSIFNRFINEFSQYDIPNVKLKVYKMAGLFYFNYEEYRNKAYIYFSKAIDNAIASNNYDELINCKISLYTSLIYLNDCEEAIRLFNEMLINNNLSNIHKYHVYNKLGHAYLTIKDYTNALDAFENSTKYIENDKGSIADMYVQKAYCYKKLENIPMTIKIIKEGLEFISTINSDNITSYKYYKNDIVYFRKLSLIKNLISAYRFICDKESMISYIEQLTKLIVPLSETSSNFIIDIYLDLFDDCIYLDNYEYAHYFCNEALRLSSQNNEFSYTNKILKNLFKLYKKYDKLANVKLLVPRVHTLLTKYPDKVDNNNVAFTLLKYYFEVDQDNVSPECKELLNMIFKEDIHEKD